MAVNPDNLPEGPVGYPWLSRIMTHGVKHVGNQDVRMGTILEVKGSNKTGKTIFGKLVIRGFEKEHDPDLIADGYDEAVTRLELVDEANVTFFVETVTTQKATKRTVGASDGRVIDRQVETWLGKLTDAYLLDPFLLLDVNREKREEFLKRVLPIRFTGDEVGSITGVPTEDCDMKQFDAILAGAESERSRLNKRKEEIEGAIKRSATGLLESTDRTDYAIRMEELQDELGGMERSLAQLKSQIEIDRLNDIHDLDAELSRKIAELKDQHRRDCGAVNDKSRSEIVKEETKREPEIRAKRLEVQEAKTKSGEQMKQKGLREHLDKERTILRSAAREATVAQDIVDKLRDLQSAKWKTLPIKGLTYTGGDLYLDGKNILDRVNTSAIYKTMFLILQHSVKPGMLPLIVIERTESLDDENRELFYNAARESGFQVIAEDVSRKKLPLTLEVIQ